MSVLDFILIWFLVMILVFFGFGKHSHNSDLVESKFDKMDKVYVLSDSIPAIIDSKFIISKSEKVNGEKKHSIIIEFYTIVYTDKNGTIHRFKNVSPDMLIERD